MSTPIHEKIKDIYIIHAPLWVGIIPPIGRARRALPPYWVAFGPQQEGWQISCQSPILRSLPQPPFYPHRNFWPPNCHLHHSNKPCPRHLPHHVWQFACLLPILVATQRGYKPIRCSFVFFSYPNYTKNSQEHNPPCGAYPINSIVQ